MADYFNESMNIISDLADQPGLSAEAMKNKFDEAGQKIKTFINETIATDIANLKSGTSLGTSSVKTKHLATDAVVEVKIKNGAVTSDKLAKQTKLVLNGSDIYGSTLPDSGVPGQIFFLKVT